MSRAHWYNSRTLISTLAFVLLLATYAVCLLTTPGADLEWLVVLVSAAYAGVMAALRLTDSQRPIGKKEDPTKEEPPPTDDGAQP